MLEPWGWQNNEYLAAAIMARLFNNNVRKKSDLKPAKEFMRDMEKELFDELKRMQKIQEFEELPEEKRKEIIVRHIKKDFGIK